MGTYSSEPSTRNLKFKYTFSPETVSFEGEVSVETKGDPPEEYVVYDTGPQAENGEINVYNDPGTNGTPVGRLITGARGLAIEQDGVFNTQGESHGVQVVGPDATSDEITFFYRFKWDKSDFPNFAGDHTLVSTNRDGTEDDMYGFSLSANSDGTMDVRVGQGGSTYFTHTTAEDLGDEEWHWLGLSLTSTEATVMIDGNVVREETVTETTWDFNGGVYMLGDFDNGFGNQFGAQDHAIDEVRLYEGEALTPDQLRDIDSLADHGQKDAIGEVWPTPGMPYIKGEGNERLAGTLGTSRDHWFSQLDETLFARQISNAGGEQLERVGDLAGVRRRSGESDDSYRSRIKAKMISGESSGTFSDILTGLSRLLSAEKEDIRLHKPIVTQEIIEDFERANPLADYADEPGTYTVTTSSAPSFNQPYHGEKAIGVDPATDADSYQSIHRTDTGVSPTQGDEFNFWVRPSENPDGGVFNQIGFRFAHNGNPTDGTDDSYWVFWLVDGDTLRLQKGPFGGETIIADQGNIIDGSSYPNNDVALNWFRINVKWDDGSSFGGSAGDFTVTLYDDEDNQIGQVTGNDTDKDGTVDTQIGWIIYVGGSGEPTWVDYAWKPVQSYTPGHCDVYAPSEEYQETGLSDGDFKAFVEDLLFAGHRATVYEGSPPFTLSDGTTNDKELGLSTSDNEGGELINQL